MWRSPRRCRRCCWSEWPPSARLVSSPGKRGRWRGTHSARSGLAQSLLTAAREEGESLFRRGAEAPRGGLRGEAGRTGGLGQAPRWLRPSGLTGASCGRRRQKPGVEGPGPQPSWPCAPLPGGGLPPSSPSHPVCAWLGCRHTAPAASPVPARASVWVSGEAWGGPVWEPLPSFRAGDQPGAESPGCGRGRLALALAPAQGQCRLWRSVCEVGLASRE